MNSKYKTLIMHTEVRWLSKGHVFSRMYSLRKGLLIYFEIEESEYATYFSNDIWCAKLAFLADIFYHLKHT